MIQNPIELTDAERIEVLPRRPDGMACDQAIPLSADPTVHGRLAGASRERSGRAQDRAVSTVPALKALCSGSM